MSSEDDGSTLLGIYPADSVADILLYNYIQADSRLVEEQYLRRMEQRGGYIGSHTLTERQGTHRTCNKAVKLQHLIEKVHTLFILIVGHLIYLFKYGIGLSERQIPPELSTLTENYADLAHIVLAILLRYLAVDAAGAGCRGKYACQHLYHSALARSVRTDEAEYLALGNGESYAVHCFDDFLMRLEQRLDRAFYPRLLYYLFKLFSQIIRVDHIFHIKTELFNQNKYKHHKKHAVTFKFQL